MREEKHEMHYVKLLLAGLLLLASFSYDDSLADKWFYLLHVLDAFLLTYLLMPVVINLAYKLKILDAPDARKVHEAPTPKLGGIAVFIAFIVVGMPSGLTGEKVDYILAASFIIWVVGAWDDISELSAKFRLFAQLLATAILMYGGVFLEIVPNSVPGGIIVDILLTSIWIIGITNAFNFLDGINGESAGVGVIIATVMSLYAYLTDEVAASIILCTLAGSLIGFLPYNLKRKADTFIGDSGSTFVGFILAAMTIQMEWGVEPHIVNLILPVMAFFICIYDTTMTTITRVWSGKVRSFQQWVDYVGTDHIHHKLSRFFCGDKLIAVWSIYLLTLQSAIFVVMYAFFYRGLSSTYFAMASLFQTLLTYSILTLFFFLSDFAKKEEEKK